MLEVKNIKKHYKLGEQTFTALKGISVSFRKTEFVSILGESGSGKTTLLNILGGLDRYNSGDLVIDNISTKNYKDKDWDAYRNHRIGFVFQNYNLIPHLDVLSNVELAQTLSGVSKEERQRRAKEVLTRVGLKEHMYKRPNQLSGGQQQRVSIARALVNNPSIILADEPTGALDSETSVDIMNLLTEISKDKLIIMVTHNGELAEKYSNRIVRLKDGLVVSDTNPYNPKADELRKDDTKKTSMSFFTALRLSFKNLLTKKVRTLITALAGSIGIIGVALVLSLQYGFTDYLNEMERGTFAGLPLTISRSYIDISALVSESQNQLKPIDPIENGVGGYDPQTSSGFETNNITQTYIDYLESSDLEEYATVVYNYGFTGQYFYLNGDTLNYNPKAPTSGLGTGGRNYVSQSGYTNEFLEDFFVPVYGRFYGESANEAILMVDNQHRVPNKILEFLGFETGEDVVVPFEEIIGKEFKIFTNNAYYKYEDNTFKLKSSSELLATYQSNSEFILTVKIVGVVKSDSEFITASEAILYSSAVSKSILDLNMTSDVVVAQRESELNVIGNMPFQFGNTKEDQLYTLGGIDLPTQILIYPNNFDSKEAIVEILSTYNEGLDEEDQIHHTDNIASALSMIKTVMDSISAVLIAFSAISLFVSSVMIGIITYTSVLERTKEIGVLRSIGARKKDISRVFNAETIIVGFIAGILGVAITYGIVPLVNIILADATGTENVAELFYVHAIALVIISVLLTFVAGLIPSKIAAGKDPVVALRTE